jgi:hypothetical protein
MSLFFLRFAQSSCFRTQPVGFPVFHVVRREYCTHEGGSARTSGPAALALRGILEKKSIVAAMMSNDLWESSIQAWDVVHVVDEQTRQSFGLAHIEVTQDHVRLEFDKASPHYLAFADLYFAARDSAVASASEPTDGAFTSTNIPDWMIPVEIRNMAHCGAGTTVLLCRHKVRVAATLQSPAPRRLPTIEAEEVEETPSTH